MPSRRQFLTVAGLAGTASLANQAFENSFSGLLTGSLAASENGTAKKHRLAVITTEWRYGSHAWHMAERFLVGYPMNGRWHHSPFEVVSAYVDQYPENDLARGRSAEFGFPLYPSISETLRCGGREMAVDAVLIIGEHGKYEVNSYHQTKYPRYAFFKQVTDIFRKEGRVLPVFNDKHLSWNWECAKEMVEITHELKVPFTAGSSLPVTWRMPSIDLPHGCEPEELMSVAIGGVDSYDFHALEVIQCMAERRKGGETGVSTMHAIRGDAFWAAMEKGSWSAGGWDPQLFEACLSRSHTLVQPETFSHRYPTLEQMKQWVKDPIAYRFEYRDGTKASMLLMNGLVGDFTFAARLKGQSEPLSTLFQLPPNPNVVYSAALMAKAEETFLTGRSPWPIERTLLTSGLVEAGARSLGEGGVRLETPHLDVKYSVGPESTFWQA
ncbi:MAG: hypothetical protein ACK526_23730 [Planctomyces sp.]